LYKVTITFLYYEECPSHDAALERLRQVMAEEGVQAEIEIIKVETDEQAQRLRFVGSPTIIVGGQDIDPPPPDAYYALTCRAYRLEDGRISPLPSPDLIRRALKRDI
jgi:MarR-like DNA-binding transcriptional regulator SgrR of sgrS sRNA